MTHRDRVEILQSDAGGRKGGADDREDPFEMRAARDLRDHAAVLLVELVLRRDRGAEHRGARHDRRRGLVAAGLDPEHQRG